MKVSCAVSCAGEGKVGWGSRRRGRVESRGEVNAAHAREGDEGSSEQLEAE